MTKWKLSQEYRIRLLVGLLAAVVMAAACSGSEPTGTSDMVPAASSTSSTTAPATTTSSVSLATTTTTIPPAQPVVMVDSTVGAGMWGVWSGLVEGSPVLVYPAGMDAYGFGGTALKMASCSDVHCAGEVSVRDVFAVEDPDREHIQRFAAAVGPSGFPIIVFNTWDVTTGEGEGAPPDTWILSCLERDCSTSSIAQIGPWPDPNQPGGLARLDDYAVAASDMGFVIGYRHWTTERVYSVLVCASASCPDDRHQDPQLVAFNDFVGDLTVGIDPQGHPIIVFGYQVGAETSSDWRIVATSCSDPQCESADTTEIRTQPGAMNRFDLAWTPDGHPIIHHGAWRTSGYTLWRTVCSEPKCASFQEKPVLNLTGPPLWWAAHTADDGSSAVAWLDSQSRLMLTICSTVECQTSHTFQAATLTPDAIGNSWMSLNLTHAAGQDASIAVATSDGVHIVNCLPETCLPEPN